MHDNVVDIQDATRRRKRVVSEKQPGYKFLWQRYFWRNCRSFTITQHGILGAMFEVASDDGDEIFWSRQSLADALEVHPNTIANNLLKLERMGWIECYKHGGTGNGTKMNNTYRLCIPPQILIP